MKTIIFILELKKSRGRGHWYRCLELSKNLKNKDGELRIVWLIDYIDKFFVDYLYKYDIHFRIGNYRDSENVLETLKVIDSDLVILDLMGLEKKYVLDIKEKVITVTIGGSGEGLSYSHISINGMFKRKKFINDFYGDKLFIGCQYIIFRSDIYKETREKNISDKIQNIFISLGADYEGRGIEIGKVIKAIYSEVNINVLTCTEKKQENTYGINIFKDIENPWKLFKNSDICITAGGMTAFEASYLGIPLMLIPSTKIQMEASNKFEEKGLGICIKHTENIKDEIKKTLYRLQEKQARETMMKNSNKLYQKKSDKLVTDIIYNELNKYN